MISNIEELTHIAQKCLQCGECMRACPNNLPIPKAMAAAAQGDLNLFCELNNHCIGCVRCEGACPLNLPIHSYIAKANEELLKGDKLKKLQLQTTTSLLSSPTVFRMGRRDLIDFSRRRRGIGKGNRRGPWRWQTRSTIPPTNFQITPSSTSLQSKEAEIQTLKERIKSLEEQLKEVKKLLDKK